MNLDSKIIQKTIQSLLTDVTPKVFTLLDDDVLEPRNYEQEQNQNRHETSEQRSSHSKTNKHNPDPATMLYEKLNAASVELNTQKNAGCFKFQESAIDVQSQVPHPETFSDKYLSREMRECIKNNSKKVLTFNCKINQRDILLHFVLFKSHRCEESVSYYKTYAHRVFMWLHMVSLKSKCVESLDLYIYLTPFKKELPENKSEVIGPVNANTGYTYRCEKKNEIVIYREEEWFKVLIHETMHTFGNDFNTEDGVDDTTATMTYMKNLFSLPQGVNIQLSETYSEIWARIMNVAFQTYFKNPPSLESRTAKQFKKNFDFYLHLEGVFSLYQCIKILDFMGVNYQHLVSDSEHSKNMMRSFYRENTHVFAYYVLTSILLNNRDDFLSWCIKNNGSGLNMFKVKATRHEFASLIASCYKKTDLLQKIVDTEMKVARDYQKAIFQDKKDKGQDQDKELVTTLRMTIVGFD
jgi:hypothetical protein